MRSTSGTGSRPGTCKSKGVNPPTACRPWSAKTLAIAVGEEADTLEDVYEPYLLQRGLIQRTPRGRAATARAYEHLGLEPPRPPGLF